MAWSGRSQPASLGLAPRQELQGRVGQGAAPHFGLEGGPEKQKGREMVGAGPRAFSGSLHGLLPSQAARGWLAKPPRQGPESWPLVPLKQAWPPAPTRRAGFVTAPSAQKDTWDGTPTNPGHRSPRSGQEERFRSGV